MEVQAEEAKAADIQQRLDQLKAATKVPGAKGMPGAGAKGAQQGFDGSQGA